MMQDTICRDPFYKVMPAYFGMTLKELIAVKHPTAWLQFEKGETNQEDLFRDFFKDGRSFDHEAFLSTVVSLIFSHVDIHWIAHSCRCFSEDIAQMSQYSYTCLTGRQLRGDVS